MQYVTYVLFGYIIGGLHAEDNGREKKAIDTITNRGVQLGLWLFASVIKIIIQYAAVMRCGEGSALILGDRIFTMIQALSVFCLFKKYMDNIHVGRLAKSISRCSFGIYLVHPFFINLLYKMMNITPTNFPSAGNRLCHSAVVAYCFSALLGNGICDIENSWNKKNTLIRGVKR